MAQVWNQMDLLTKCLLGRGLEKVKVVEASNSYDEPEFDFVEKSNFLNNWGGPRHTTLRTKVRTMAMIITMTNPKIVAKAISKIWINSGAIKLEHISHS